MLLIVAFLAALLAWRIDRTIQAATHKADFAKLLGARRASDQAGLFSTPSMAVDTIAEHQLYDIMYEIDDKSEQFLHMMSVYSLRERIEDPRLVRMYIQSSMRDLGCETIVDLRRLVDGANWKWNAVLKSKTPESQEFEAFIEVLRGFLWVAKP
ncbi:hypothetical protein MFFC18_18500 [Mariniblastus fucicola]|uniref:Uncharacterized protein n=2 Tax=Mariniblastus fucicola TaxID=980251 RepID=A0A5B9P978_9BACT|nr:hypothetical protein MFFC18_18500 [Mariniblastus fucicola]